MTLRRDHPDELHVVLDNDERLGLIDVTHKLDGAQHLLVRHSGRGLVEQHKIGIRREHHAKFDPLALSVSQLPDEP